MKSKKARIFVVILKNELPTHVSQVKRYLQVPPEVVRKAGVDVQDLQQVVPMDAVKVTVGGGAHVRIRLPGLIVQVNGLTKDVILLCKCMNTFDLISLLWFWKISEVLHFNYVLPNMATAHTFLWFGRFQRRCIIVRSYLIWPPPHHP